MHKKQDGVTKNYRSHGKLTQREVAVKLKISQVRVGQIERQALRKLVAGLQANKELQQAYADMVF